MELIRYMSILLNRIDIARKMKFRQSVFMFIDRRHWTWRLCVSSRVASWFLLLILYNNRKKRTRHWNRMKTLLVGVWTINNWFIVRFERIKLLLSMTSIIRRHSWIEFALMLLFSRSTISGIVPFWTWPSEARICRFTAIGMLPTLPEWHKRRCSMASRRIVRSDLHWLSVHQESWHLPWEYLNKPH